MSTTGPAHISAEPTVDDVVRWLSLSDSTAMAEVVGKLDRELAKQLFGAGVLGVTRALQHAAKELRGAPATDADTAALFKQFALEIDDILARLGAAMAIQKAP